MWFQLRSKRGIQAASPSWLCAVSSQICIIVKAETRSVAFFPDFVLVKVRMDPISVLSLVETCAGLAVTAGQLAISMKSLAETYKKAALTFRSLSSQCKLFSTTVRAIQDWMEDAPDTSRVDGRIWEQLADSLECANDAIYALETELTSTSGGSVNTFWDKADGIWNLPSLKGSSGLHSQTNYRPGCNTPDHESTYRAKPDHKPRSASCKVTASKQL